MRNPFQLTSTFRKYASVVEHRTNRWAIPFPHLQTVEEKSVWPQAKVPNLVHYEMYFELQSDHLRPVCLAYLFGRNIFPKHKLFSVQIHLCESNKPSLSALNPGFCLFFVILLMVLLVNENALSNNPHDSPLWSHGNQWCIYEQLTHKRMETDPPTLNHDFIGGLSINIIVILLLLYGIILTWLSTLKLSSITDFSDKRPMAFVVLI